MPEGQSGPEQLLPDLDRFTMNSRCARCLMCSSPSRTPKSPSSTRSGCHSSATLLREKVTDESWLTLRCEDLWATPNLFGEDGVCPSLTSCSPDRVADAYTTWVAYRDIGNKIVEEYNLYGAGQTIPYNSTYNTGNIVRASSVFLQTSDVVGSAKFNYTDASGNVQLSVCECYHPSKYGQNLLSSLLWDGVSCSTTTPCCNDDVVGDSDYNKGLCNNYTTSGSDERTLVRNHHSGLFGHRPETLYRLLSATGRS